MCCNKCNQRLPNDSEFCQYCGTKLEVTPVDEQTVEASTNTVINAEAVKTTEQIIERKNEDTSAEIAEHEASVLTVVKKKILESTNEQNEEVHNHKETQETQKENSSTAPVSVAPSDKKTPKKRFCKLCGGLIDSELKKCASCGKQYFKLPKFNKTVFLLVLCSLLLGLNIFQFVQGFYVRNEITQSRTTISTQKKTVAQQKLEIADLKKDVDKYKEQSKKYFNDYFAKAFFLDSHIVIIGDSNNKYHKYGCSDLDTSSFYAYNTENARAQGYRACSKCN